MTGPYVVTVKITRGAVTGRSVVPKVTSRRAVATLDEARSDTRAIALDHNSIGGAQKAMRLPESGGTVGPFPDGTVIEVQSVEWQHLGWMAGVVNRSESVRESGRTHAEIIAAYNEARP